MSTPTQESPAADTPPSGGYAAARYAFVAGTDEAVAVMAAVALCRRDFVPEHGITIVGDAPSRTEVIRAGDERLESASSHWYWRDGEGREAELVPGRVEAGFVVEVEFEVHVQAVV